MMRDYIWVLRGPTGKLFADRNAATVCRELHKFVPRDTALALLQLVEDDAHEMSSTYATGGYSMRCERAPIHHEAPE